MTRRLILASVMVGVVGMAVTALAGVQRGDAGIAGDHPVVAS